MTHSSDFASEAPASPTELALRLGIDGEALRAPLSGVGQYVFSLCRELDRLLPDALFFAYSRLPASRLVLPSNRWVVRAEPNVGLRRLPSFLWLKTRGAALCARDRLHVFWAGRTLHPRLREPTRTVCTIHDLNHLLVPSTMQASTLWSHRLWFKGDVARAHHVIANSRGTAQRIGTLLMRNPDSIVMPGLEAGFHPPTAEENRIAVRELQSIGVRAPYLLSVSTLEPRKNIRVLIEAFGELKREGRLDGYKLVLVGASGWKSAGLYSQAPGVAGDVIETGYVPRQLLPALYANAEAFILPSLYEGFGMPALEARACGTRVVVSDTPELRDAGGPHAIYVNPTNAGVRTGILRALETPPPVERDLCEDHDWSRAAAQLAEVIHGIMHSGR